MGGSSAEWYSIPKETVEKLYASLPRRVFNIVLADGWYTKYILLVPVSVACFVPSTPCPISAFFTFTCNSVNTPLIDLILLVFKRERKIRYIYVATLIYWSGELREGG